MTSKQRTIAPPRPGTSLDVRIELPEGAPWPFDEDFPGVSGDGTRVFVRGVAPGDDVTVEVVGSGAFEAHAMPISWTASGQMHTEPFCAHVDTCGGCPWMRVRPEAQRAMKADAAASLLEIAADGRPRGEWWRGVVPIAPGEAGVRGYRTKLQMAVDRGARLGFFAPHSRQHVEVEECPVQDPEGNRVLRMAARALWELHLGGAREKSPVVRWLIGRAVQGGWALLLVATQDLDEHTTQDLAQLLSRIRDLHSVALNVNPELHGLKTNTVLGKQTRPLFGPRRVPVRVLDETYLLSPDAFFQTSVRGAAALVRAILEDLPARMDRAIDLYAGGGLFTLPLARRARRVLAVESATAAAEDLVASARGMGQQHVQVFTRPVDEWLGSTSSAPGLGADVIVLDPPRAGMGPDLMRRTLSRVQPKRILYVSCSPKSLARDIEALAPEYALASARGLDLFPHTPHLEIVARFEKR